jgi:prephenate dehydrogenase
MSLDDHDRLIVYLPRMSNMLNIALFTAFAESGEGALKLARPGTVGNQFDVATRVARESPELHFEIHSLNDHGVESFDALLQAIDLLRTTVLSHDHEGLWPCCTGGVSISRPPECDRAAFLKRRNLAVFHMRRSGRP